MKTKFCADCTYWLYQESIAGIGQGSCENEDSEYVWQTVPENNSCNNFVIDDFECEEEDDCK